MLAVSFTHSTSVSCHTPFTENSNYLMKLDETFSVRPSPFLCWGHFREAPFDYHGWLDSCGKTLTLTRI